MGAIGGSGVSIEEALPLDGSQAMTGTLSIDQNANGSALVIDSESTTVDVFNIDAPATTTGNVIICDNADSLTTGKILDLRSNSSDTSNRFLAFIRNTNTAATGATCLGITQNATRQAIEIGMGTVDAGYIDFRGTADADATSAISTLTTSGATTHHVQVEINGVKAWIAVSTTNPS